MKKIIYIANIRIPTERAHGIQIINMCEAFAHEVIEVELLVPWRFNDIYEDTFLYYDIEKNFKITKIFSLDLVQLSRVEFVQLGRVGFWIQSFSFATFSSLYVLFKKADTIYSRDELPLWFLSFFKKNLVWEVHMPRDNVIARMLRRRIKKIITISQGLKDFYISKGVPSERIFVAHDGVDLHAFSVEVEKKEVRAKLGLPLSKPIAMYIGRLDKWKGVKTLLEASKRMDGVQVVIVGEGDQLKEFKKHYPNAIFTGPLPYRDLPYNQQAADILIVPNSADSDISRLYTSPLKVFAHMASGIPIVVSDLPALREIVNNEVVYFFEPDNETNLVETILYALSHKDESLKKAKKAKHIVQNYSWQNRVKKILAFIQ